MTNTTTVPNEPAPTNWRDAALQAADRIVNSEAYGVRLSNELDGLATPYDSLFGLVSISALRELLSEATQSLELLDTMNMALDALGLTLAEAVAQVTFPEGEVCAECGTDHSNLPEEVDTLTEMAWGNLTSIAAIVTTFKDSPDSIYDVIPLIESKQRDYGHGNILAHGMTGVLVRLSDKIARLENLARRSREGKDASPQNETVADTFIDIIGYIIIIRMLLDGTFTLDLSEDQ